MKIVPFRAEDLFLLEAQDAQRGELNRISLEQAKSLERLNSVTFVEDGKILLCGGAVEYHSQRALVWSYVAACSGASFIKVHRGVKRFFDCLPYNRLEMDVALGFEQGHRWAKMLGFELETPVLKKYYEDGQDAACYVRIR